MAPAPDRDEACPEPAPASPNTKGASSIADPFFSRPRCFRNSHSQVRTAALSRPGSLRIYRAICVAWSSDCHCRVHAFCCPGRDGPSGHGSCSCVLAYGLYLFPGHTGMCLSDPDLAVCSIRESRDDHPGRGLDFCPARTNSILLLCLCRCLDLSHSPFAPKRPTLQSRER